MSFLELKHKIKLNFKKNFYKLTIISQSFRSILGIFNYTSIIISHYRRNCDNILFLNIKHEVVCIILRNIISHFQNGGEIIFEFSIIEGFNILILKIRVSLKKMIQAWFKFLNPPNIFQIFFL
jgi:hypothetical protein